MTPDDIILDLVGTLANATALGIFERFDAEQKLVALNAGTFVRTDRASHEFTADGRKYRIEEVGDAE